MNFFKQLAKFGDMEEVNAKSSNDDYMFDFPFGKKSIKHYRQIVPVQIHHFYLDEAIGDTSTFHNLLNTLKTSEQHDTIFIYLNTPGGNLYTAIQIIAAIKQSTATVVTVMEGMVASAGTMIFLAGHRFIVAPNTTFMAHNYSGYSGGKGNEIKSRQKFDEDYFHDLMQDVYKGFLTEDEIAGIMEDRDVWLKAHQVIERLPKNRVIPHNPAAQQDDSAQNLLAALLGGGGDTGSGSLSVLPLDFSSLGGLPPETEEPKKEKKPAKKKPATKKTPAKKAPAKKPTKQKATKEKVDTPTSE